MRLLPPLLLISLCTFAQPDPQIDSLLNALNTARHDTTKIKVLDALSEVSSHDFAALESYGNQLKDLTQSHIGKSSGKDKIFYYHYYATALNNLAYIEENKSHSDGAIELYEKALQTFQEIDDKVGEAMCFVNLGFVYKKTGDLPRSVEFYSKAYEINKEIDNKPGMFSALNNVGLSFFTMGDMKKALSMYFEALNIANELGDKKRQARSYNNIAGVYFAQKEYQLQLENLEKSLALIIESGDKRVEVIIRGNMVVELIRGNQIEKAHEYAQRCIDVSNEMNDKEGLSNAYSSMVKVLRAKKEYQTAFDLEQKSYEIRKGLKIKGHVAYCLGSMGELLRDMHRDPEAIRYFSEALTLYREIGNKIGTSDQAKNLSDTYKAVGQTAKALQYYELHIAVRDSITNDDNRKEAFKSQYKYEYDLKATADSLRSQTEKTVLNAQLNQERSQRYALTALVILAVTIASFGFYRFRVKQQLKELKLRNQIASDLHDEVGSAISSISLFAGLARMKTGKDSEDIVAKIENTSRETVDNMSDIVWSIEPANDRFDNVLRKMTFFGEQLMASLGIGFTLAYQQDMDRINFDMPKRKNIYLIYKEAINNAAKYSGATKVEVQLTKNGRQYVMEIKDNGKGFDTHNGTMGNGLRNMKRRAEEIGGSLVIESNEGGTVVKLVAEI
jgi:signal transduction histidine kinase